MKKNIIKIIFVVSLVLLWQIVYQLNIFPELMFPSAIEIGKAFVNAFRNDSLLQMTGYSIKLIGKGLGAGILLALSLSALSMINKTFHSLYSMVVSMFDLIPGVALIPIVVLWFGIGENTILVIVIHSVLWPLSRSIIDAFLSIPKQYIEAGQNLELSKLRLVFDVYLPASFERILSGLRVGWARAWRGLISAEMIFGTTGAGAGIGWYIFLKRTTMDIPGVYAALLVIILIGSIVEYIIFYKIETHTVRKWNMK